MHSFKGKFALVISGIALALLVFMAPAVKGDDWNLKTIITVSHPFSVPGKVLEPNTKYVLKLLDLQGNRNVIQLFNEDQSELLTTFMAASDYRLEPADETTFEFIEVNEGYPKPIRSWFYPGRLNGKEFIYPKDQAMDIVANSRQSVLTAEGRVDLHDLDTYEIAALDPDDVVLTGVATAQDTIDTDIDINRDVDVDTDADVDLDADLDADIDTDTQPMDDADTDATLDEPLDYEPSQTQTDESFETEPEPVMQDDADMQDDSAIEEESEESLPATAGELPLIGLIGALCVGLALSLRAFAVRS
jgi:hypothetical protein